MFHSQTKGVPTEQFSTKRGWGEKVEQALPPLPWSHPHTRYNHLHPPHPHWVGDMSNVILCWWEVKRGGVVVKEEWWWRRSERRRVAWSSEKEKTEQNKEKIWIKGKHVVGSQVGVVIDKGHLWWGRGQTSKELQWQSLQEKKVGSEPSEFHRPDDPPASVHSSVALV